MSGKISQLIQSFEHLQQYQYTDADQARRTNAKAEQTFHLIFDIVKQDVPHTRDEWRALEELLPKAILPLRVNVQRDACLYKTTLPRSILIKRSAIQYLLNNFGDTARRCNLQESVSILDNIIADYKDESDSDEGRQPQQVVNVPASHTWWQ